jgi:hypothetical protein
VPKKQEVGSDHLAIVAEFAFTPVEDESEKEDESEGEVRTARHIYFSSDSESGWGRDSVNWKGDILLLKNRGHWVHEELHLMPQKQQFAAVILLISFSAQGFAILLSV